MCMSGIHYVFEDEEEEKANEAKNQVKEELICSYSGLPSVASYENKKGKKYEDYVMDERAIARSI